MSDKHVEFRNPDYLPIEAVLLTVTNAGVIQQIKALDPYWVDNKTLSIYERPPSGSSMVIGAVDMWKTKMAVYLTDLKWLLSLEYHRFWSTVLYHPTCMDTLVSFLQEATPPYLPPHESKEIQNLYEEIRRFVLIVFSRLVTNKESKSCWMSKEYMGDVLYNNFIFTIPIIWDICLTYGVDNTRHVSRVLDSLFTLQPRYETDAVAAVAFVHEAFKFIILQVNKDYDSDEPPNLPETFKGFSEIRRPSNSKTKDKLTFEVLKDLIIHLLDTALTLRIFIQVYPKGVNIFRKTNFVLSIVQLYEYGVPQLYEKLEEVGDQTSVAYTEVESYLDTARAELIDVFREILAVYKNAIFSEEGSKESHVEDYLAVMMEGLSERLLIKDYHSCYPVHEDLDLLRQACPEIDTVKTDFILQAVYSSLDEPAPEPAPPPATNTAAPHIGIPHPAPPDSEIPDTVKEQSLISEVRDILPHLGDGFILKCLQHYGFNSERVINSVLEDNLAEPLRALDRSLPIIPEDPVDRRYLETGIQRLNVFDGDEFDLMSRDDVVTARMHVGKRRSKYKDLTQMLDDKTELRGLADIYAKYSVVCDEEDMYSDEYDDTDDWQPPAAGDHPPSEESEEEPEPEEEKPSSSRNRMDFCVNPEELRARREASFQARRGRGYRPPAKNVDVVGKAKGQGQEKNVLVNRERKEKNKSSRGNHSRRQGAQWKRTQGLVPS